MANNVTFNNVETVIGTSGDDYIINGTATAINITGGAGADTLTGNSVGDTFDYTTVSDSYFNSMDKITNLQAGGAGEIDTNIIGTMGVVTDQGTGDTFANLTETSLNALINSTNGTLGTTLTGDGVNSQAMQLSTSDLESVWVIDVDGSGVIDAADTVIQVTNLSGTIDAADFV